MPRSGKVAVDDPKAFAMYQPSRPLLEGHVRRRLRALENVTIHDGHDVAELTSTADHKRVNGVRMVERDGGADRELPADLVVDAMAAPRTHLPFWKVSGMGDRSRTTSSCTACSYNYDATHDGLSSVTGDTFPVV